MYYKNSILLLLSGYIGFTKAIIPLKLNLILFANAFISPADVKSWRGEIIEIRDEYISSKSDLFLFCNTGESVSVRTVFEIAYLISREWKALCKLNTGMPGYILLYIIRMAPVLCSVLLFSVPSFTVFAYLWHILTNKKTAVTFNLNFYISQ